MILLVGASVRALMESAAASGYEVMGIDFFGDVDACWQGKTISLVQDCNLPPTVKHLMKIAKTISCHGLVYGAGPENYPEELNDWEGQGLLRGNGASVLKEVRNPWKLCQSLAQIDVKMPGFFSLEHWQRLSEDENKWLLKPLHRGGGHGIVELAGKKTAVGERISAVPNPDRYIIEKYVEGIPCSLTFLANGQEAILLGTSRQLIGRGRAKHPFRYEGNITPLDLRGIFDQETFLAEAVKIIQHLTRDFGLSGLNTLDFIMNGQGIWVLELNPRWSASVELIEGCLGKRLFSAHLAAWAGVGMEKISQELFAPSPKGKENRSGICPDKKGKFFGKTIVYAGDSLVMEEGDEKKFRFLYAKGVRDIPQAGTSIKKGQPICTVLAQGATSRECLLGLTEKSRWVQQFYLDKGT